MTTPESIIAAKRSAIESRVRDRASIDREIEVMQSELRGMEAMAEIFRSAGNRGEHRPRSASTSPVATAKGGRQPGTITKSWQQALASILALKGAHFSVADVISTVKAIHGRDLRPSEVRRIFQGYATYGHVEIEANDRYRMTDQVIEKYGLAGRSSSEVASGATEETEAPGSIAAGASVSAGWGASTPQSAWINPQS